MIDKTIEKLKSEIEDLKNKKKIDYDRAIKSGVISKLYILGRELGRRLPQNYGPKYLFELPNLAEIYVDDYGGYMDVYYEKRIVCSTHFCKELFIPGPWCDELMKLVPEAMSKRDQRAIKKLTDEKNELIESLGGNK